MREHDEWVYVLIRWSRYPDDPDTVLKVARSRAGVKATPECDDVVWNGNDGGSPHARYHIKTMRLHA